MKTESQNKLIEKHLKAGLGITPLMALHNFGCLRLSGRIYDLRKKGMKITTQMIAVDSGKYVAFYYLEN